MAVPLSLATLDRLPFGAVRLDAAGRVERFNATEAAQSGYGSRPTLGLDFFTGIAPCMNQPDFRGRLESGLASGRLNLRFGWTGDFSDANRALDIRVLGRAGLGQHRRTGEVAEYSAAALGHHSSHHLAQLSGFLISQWLSRRGCLLTIDEVRDHGLARRHRCGQPLRPHSLRQRSCRACAGSCGGPRCSGPCRSWSA